jgi:molybdate/tungstate transport system ATP-binding protein
MLSIDKLSFRQGDFKLDDISFGIQKSEYVVLMGKTGCGKTTILEAICGLRAIHSGSILLDGRDISRLKPSERSIGYVPQDGALFSSMDVQSNLSFALRIRKWEKPKITERVNELAELLGVGHLLNRKIGGLSGGERQRIALGRGLAFYPEFLCMDEPLSALDEPTRDDMYELLQKLKKELKITALHISHSSSDADKLADRILKIENEKIVEL